MAIEVRELVIRAVLEPEEKGGGGGGGAGAGGGPAPPTEEIVAECVEQVLDILRRREER